MTKDERIAALEAENFNLKAPIGTSVLVWPFLREGAGELGKTESEARVYGKSRAAYAIVYVRREGKACSMFSLSHVEVIA